MSFVPPAGRISALETPQGVLHIQTEFALTPEPRITTSVILNGKVLEKENYPCSAELLFEQNREQLENQLLEQHKKVTESLQQKNEKELTAIEEIQKPALNETEKITAIIENLKTIKGVKKVLILDSEVLKKEANSDFSLYSSVIEEKLTKVLSLAQQIQNLTRVGNLKEAQGTWENHSFFILGSLSPHLGVLLEPQTELASLQTQIQLILAKNYVK